jgi:LuxR family maltose regulon positive regulatory protein
MAEGPRRTDLCEGAVLPRAARLRLARHAPDQALDLLDHLRAGAEAQRRMGSVIEIGALQALALDQAGKRARALAAVAEVLALACPEGYLRVFADEGPAMATLVGELIARREGGPRHTAGAVPLDYLGRLLWAFERDRVSRPQSRLPATTLGSALVLTDRELEVLALLAAGKPNREIVDDLVVTVDTVKKHVTHILDKLGATNRTQAVACARELALIR